MRPVVAAVPAAGVVAFAWTLLEQPLSPAAFAAVGALALAPALLRDGRMRAAAAPVALVAALSAAFETWPRGALDQAWSALHDAPAVRAPFDPAAYPSLHGLVALAVFGLALVVGLSTAANRPAGVVAAVVVGVGFPAVLLENAHAARLGALALAAVLWAAMTSSIRDGRRGLPGLALAAVVIAGSSGIALAGLTPGDARVDWRGWDPFAGGGRAVDVRYVWDASYSGIDFPTRATVVLKIRAPKRAEYWRVSTLETFAGDRWIENLYPVDVGNARRALPADPLVPRRDSRPGDWLKQEVTVEGLQDARIAAASQPARVDGLSLGRILYLEGGVMRSGDTVRRGTEYKVWSFAPRPTPRELAASPPRYPAAADRYLELGRARFPGFAASGRVAQVDRLFTDERYLPLWSYRALWEDARRLTASAQSPYEATLVLERWFRSRGGFRYEEHPPRSAGNPPLVDFVEVARAGYCQHFAGAMAVMLRMIGVPARVAVGFTAGTWKSGVWTVTDHQAHAWVEAWFAGYGWLAFDPTPGRGTLSAVYTLASDSADAVRALGTGRFLDFTPTAPTKGARQAPVVAAPAQRPSAPWWLVAALVAPFAAAASVVGVKEVRRVRRLRARDARRLASGVRAELVSALVDRGADVDADATPTELRRAAERVLATSAGPLTDAIAEARYGPDVTATGAAARARVELRRVLSAARDRERPAARLRAALSLRSLRPGWARSAP